MVGRQVASIIWHEPGDQIEVVFEEGDSDHLFGSEEVATALAVGAGLEPALAPVDVRRWVRGR